MRTFLLFIVMTLSVAASAQMEKKAIKGGDLGGVYVVPRAFTYGDKAYFAVKQHVEYNYKTGCKEGAVETIDLTYDIYNDDIEKVKSIPAGHYQERFEFVQYSKYLDVFRASTWEEAKEKMKNDANYSKVTGIDDSKHRFYIENDYDVFFYWDSSKNMVYIVLPDYRWKPYESHEKTDRPVIIRYVDYDDAACQDQEFIFSQTLFNDDELFEYIVPTYSTATGNEFYDINGDGIVDEDDATYYKVTDLDIVQEGGNVLQSISMDLDAIGFDNHLTVLKLNGKYYLVFRCNSEMVFYRIEKSVASGVRLNRVQALPVGNAIYNLQGQKVDSPKANAVYIQNGKKFVSN